MKLISDDLARALRARERDWYSTPEWGELWSLDLCAICGERCSLMGIATLNGNSEIPSAIYFLHHREGEGLPCKYKIRSARTLRAEIRELVDALNVMRALGAAAACDCTRNAVAARYMAEHPSPSLHKPACPMARGGNKDATR
jgi:hypothetical protein